MAAILKMANRTKILATPLNSGYYVSFLYRISLKSEKHLKSMKKMLKTAFLPLCSIYSNSGHISLAMVMIDITVKVDMPRMILANFRQIPFSSFQRRRFPGFSELELSPC